MPAPPDQAERDRAIACRASNLLVDAGAGTGKTTLIVARLLEMIAPKDDGPALPLERVAAVTFTRRAAGELRFRVRQQLLRRLADPETSALAMDRLRAALGTLDTAFIGTIHSFADRLLRLFPIEAGISPSYEIEDDASETMLEAYRVLLDASQGGTLHLRLEGTRAEGLAEEAAGTVLDALAAGLRPDSEEYETHIKAGLDLLVQRMLEQRDVVPRALDAVPFDRASFDAVAREVIAKIDALTGDGKGERWCRRLARRLGELAAAPSPAALCDLIHAIYEIVVHPDTKIRQKEFTSRAGIAFWKEFANEPSLADRLVDPLRRWLAVKLARLLPVVEVLYERIKSRRGVVDSIDLLLKLRDLLQNDGSVRARLQAHFDHIFVDEFQDTDPLQAEILLFLSENGAQAATWRDVVPAPGRLTIVGDPKQSIYRFRRADVALYDAVRTQVGRHPHESVRLSANFRSTPDLIGWQNRCFETLLRIAPSESPFDAVTGTVYHQPLQPGRTDEAPASVHVLPFLHADGEPKNALPARELEAEAVAHYVRWVTSAESGVTVIDPVTGQRRSARASDVAVLALVTTNVPILLRALDRCEVPYAAFGGKLFLTDGVHQQFLLGLRALADTSDGVAEAALLRPPFFAIDLADVLDAQSSPESSAPSEPVARVRAARAWITNARKERFARSPGATARSLLEETAFGRTIALGPNGAQRLSMLGELCLTLEHLAASEQLDFDAVTARTREWVAEPVPMYPPRPVGAAAIQVMTVHQAKGLEFPIVVLWDGMGPLKAPHRSAIWAIDRLGEAWTIQIAGLKWEEPKSAAMADREMSFVDAERRRLVYVAVTRARDLLVLPRPKVKKPELHIFETLIVAGGQSHPVVRTLDPWREGVGASWASPVGLPVSELHQSAQDEEAKSLAQWQTTASRASVARFRPIGVSTLAHAPKPATPPPPEVEIVDVDEPSAPPTKLRKGRFGPVFGETVHRAIAWAVGKDLTPAAAVRRAAMVTGLDPERWADAAEDVARTAAALAREDLGASHERVVRFEYPLAVREASGEGHVLLSGYIDFVSSLSSSPEVVVVDFKTDAAPEGAVELAYPAYVEQVRTYARLVAGAAPARAGLLFTATGQVHWC